MSGAKEPGARRIDLGVEGDREPDALEGDRSERLLAQACRRELLVAQWVDLVDGVRLDHVEAADGQERDGD